MRGLVLELELGFSYVRARFRVRISDYVGVLHPRPNLISSLSSRVKTGENRLPYVKLLKSCGNCWDTLQ